MNSQINEFLSLKLEGKEIKIYIENSLYIPKENNYFKNEIDSRLKIEKKFDLFTRKIKNWFENDYNTDELNPGFSIPLLKKLVDSGDPIALNRFRNDIYKRLCSSKKEIILYLLKYNYISYFSVEQLAFILENIHPNLSQYLQFQIKIAIYEYLYNSYEPDAKVYLKEALKKENISLISNSEQEVKVKRFIKDLDIDLDKSLIKNKRFHFILVGIFFILITLLICI